MSSLLDHMLPKGIVPATVHYPRTMLWISEYKTGKSSIAAALSKTRKALWIVYDEEDPGDFLAGHKINVPQEVAKINAAGPASPVWQALKVAHPQDGSVFFVPKVSFCMRLWAELAEAKPYDYVFHDKLDTLEDWAEVAATVEYKRTVIGRNFGGDSVLELPDGAGHEPFRKQFKRMWVEAVKAAPANVFFGSIRTNRKTDKTGAVFNRDDVDLYAKVRKIVGGQVDAPAKMWREADGKNWLSFRTTDATSFVGNRCPHLEGQMFPISWKEPDESIFVDWGKIFPEEMRDGVWRLKV